jgi:phosphomannomutase
VKRLLVNPEEFAGRHVTKIDRTDGLQMTFDDGAWVLMRPSGTEPVVRIYSESSTIAESQKIADDARKWITN